MYGADYLELVIGTEYTHDIFTDPELRRRNSGERCTKEGFFGIRSFTDKNREPGDFLRLQF